MMRVFPNYVTPLYTTVSSEGYITNIWKVLRGIREVYGDDGRII